MRQRLAAFLGKPVIFDNDDDGARRGQLLQTVILGSVATVLIWTILTSLDPLLRHRLAVALPMAALLTATFVLSRRGRIGLASAVLVGGLWLLLHAGWMSFGAVRETSFAWSLLVVLMAALLLGRRVAFALAGVTMVVDLALLYAQTQGHIPPPVALGRVTAIAYVSVLVLSMTLLYAATHSIDQSLERSRQELEERHRAEAELQRKLRELTLLGNVATIAAEEEDEASLIARATAAIRDALFPDNCGVLLLDEAAGVLRYTTSFHAGSPRQGEGPIPVGTGIVGRVAATGQVRRIDDAALDPDYIARDPGMRSEICVPLIVGPRILGVFDVESRQLSAFSDDDERVLFTLGCLLATAIERLRDVAELRRAEQELRESQERWRRISEASFEGIAFSEKGVLLDANDQFARMHGYALHELIGKPVSDLVAPEQRALVEARIQAASTLIHAHLGQRKDQSIFPVETRARLLTMEGRTLRVTVVRDMSEHARLESELEKRQRLAAVGEIVAAVAHEVRTPLFSISATVDAYENNLDQPEVKREFMNLLRSQVQRLSSLMRDLLEYARPPALRFARGGVTPVIGRAIRACGRLADEAGVSIREEFATDLGDLDRDPERLEQVFHNLLTNAIHHAPRGSTVLLRASVCSAPPGVLCSVEDAGSGIRADDLRHLFQPFFSRRRGGTGLGLAIVQRIVEQHNGWVSAANRPSGGAVFTVFIPGPKAQAA